MWVKGPRWLSGQDKHLRGVRCLLHDPEVMGSKPSWVNLRSIVLLQRLQMAQTSVSYQGHEMFLHDPEAMGSSLSRVEFGLHSLSV